MTTVSQQCSYPMLAVQSDHHRIVFSICVALALASSSSRCIISCTRKQDTAPHSSQTRCGKVTPITTTLAGATLQWQVLAPPAKRVQAPGRVGSFHARQGSLQHRWALLTRYSSILTSWTLWCELWSVDNSTRDFGVTPKILFSVINSNI
ncbi:hypothetical protein E2C01_038054 [Portunus trituberculatus]|uniref:Uncharacterized protein n=1 Tax=Portunus trituberculatus TaxID=210409 RepID=A0A5B7F9T3_PORTR|nr:hypothetical protein [Portunus trituberculatus]